MGWQSHWRYREFFEAKLRIERAHKHLTELEDVLKWYGDDLDPHPIDEVDRDGFVDSVEIGELESGEIQVIIGDFIHNLRSALNYIAVAVWRHDSPEIEIPTTFQFPIESTQKRFSDHRPTRMKGISDKHIAVFQRFQPYSGCHWMKFLADFSKTDKHYNFIRVNLALNEWAGTFDTKTADREEIVQMYRFTEYEVTFPDGMPIIETLKEIQTQVANVLEEFNTSLVNELKAKIAAIKKAKK
jgi:hypothetical protein